MHCEQAEMLIPQFIYNELSAEDTALVSAHLTTCASCTQSCKELKEASSFLESALKAPSEKQFSEEKRQQLLTAFSELKPIVEPIELADAKKEIKKKSNFDAKTFFSSIAAVVLMAIGLAGIFSKKFLLEQESNMQETIVMTTSILPEEEVALGEGDSVTKQERLRIQNGRSTYKSATVDYPPEYQKVTGAEAKAQARQEKGYSREEEMESTAPKSVLPLNATDTSDSVAITPAEVERLQKIRSNFLNIKGKVKTEQKSEESADRSVSHNIHDYDRNSVATNGGTGTDYRDKDDEIIGMGGGVNHPKEYLYPDKSTTTSYADQGITSFHMRLEDKGKSSEKPKAKWGEKPNNTPSSPKAPSKNLNNEKTEQVIAVVTLDQDEEGEVGAKPLRADEIILPEVDSRYRQEDEKLQGAEAWYKSYPKREVAALEKEELAPLSKDQLGGVNLWKDKEDPTSKDGRTEKLDGSDGVDDYEVTLSESVAKQEGRSKESVHGISLSNVKYGAANSIKSEAALNYTNGQSVVEDSDVKSDSTQVASGLQGGKSEDSIRKDKEIEMLKAELAGMQEQGKVDNDVINKLKGLVGNGQPSDFTVAKETRKPKKASQISKSAPQKNNEKVTDHFESENNSAKQTVEDTEEEISDTPQVGSGLQGEIGGGRKSKISKAKKSNQNKEEVKKLTEAYSNENSIQNKEIFERSIVANEKTKQNQNPQKDMAGLPLIDGIIPVEELGSSYSWVNSEKKPNIKEAETYKFRDSFSDQVGTTSLPADVEFKTEDYSKFSNKEIDELLMKTRDDLKNSEGVNNQLKADVAKTSSGAGFLSDVRRLDDYDARGQFVKQNEKIGETSISKTRDEMRKMRKKKRSENGIINEFEIPFQDVVTYPAEWDDFIKLGKPIGAAKLEKEVDGDTKMQTYSVLDLVTPPKSFYGPDISPGEGAVVEKSKKESRVSELTEDNIKELIKETIAKDSWDEAKGTSIEVFQGKVIVVHNEEVQKKVSELLNKIQKSTGYEIGLEEAEKRGLDTQIHGVDDIQLKRYDVRDMTSGINDFAGPDVSLLDKVARNNAKIKKMTGEGKFKEKLSLEDLKILIQENVAKEDWDVEKGNSIVAVSGQLIITGNEMIQNQVDAFLLKLDEKQKKEVQWKKAILKKMEQPVTFDFTNTSFRDGLNELSKLTNITVAFDKNLFAKGGIDPDAPIQMIANGMTARNALKWILANVGADFSLEDQALIIKSKDQVEVDGKVEAEQTQEEVAPAKIEPKKIAINPFVNTTADSLSTFSIDTDSASYYVCRQSLLNGVLPQESVVRPEEFVNAFDYNYCLTGQKTFAITTDCMRSPLNSNLHILKVGIKGKVLGRDGRKPVHVVLVVDTSGSMAKETRLPMVKKGIEKLVTNMQPGDRISLVTYGSDVTLNLEYVPIENIDQIQAAVEALKTGGSTDLAKGVMVGYQIAATHFKKGAMNQVMICSDGVANVGHLEADKITKKVEAYKKQGVSFTSIGFGSGDYNDQLLVKLALRGDGFYYYVNSEEDVSRVFENEIGASFSVIAKDVKLQVAFKENRVLRYRLIGYEAREVKDKDFRNNAVDGGEIISGKSVTAIYELELAKAASAKEFQESLGTVTVRFQNIENGRWEEDAVAITGKIQALGSPRENPYFYLAYCAATFAEIMRKSPYVKPTAIGQIEGYVRKISEELVLNDQAKDLLKCIQAYEKLMVKDK